jgi:hypothetical protein
VFGSTRRRGLFVVALGATVLAGATGCTLPDVSLSPGVTQAAGSPSTGAAAANATATTPTAPAATTTPRATGPTRRSGDLDSGTATHSLPAGARTVVIDYWTTSNAKRWRAAGTKSIQLAAHIEGGGSVATVQVTKFLATADDGTSRSTVAQDDGQFAITPPFSYSSVISLTPSSPRAKAVTLYVQFDLLVETAPRSGQFFRQTVQDSLQLPFLQEDSQ